MFWQYYYGFAVEQALNAGLVQIRGKLQAQAFRALIIGSEQFWLNAEQVALVTRLALVEYQLAAQVRQVMLVGTDLYPGNVAGDGGREDAKTEQAERFTHGNRRLGSPFSCRSG